MPCTCQIIPKDILERFSRDRKLDARQKKAFADAANFEDQWRKLRVEHARTALAARALIAGRPAAVAAPQIVVYDCKHGTGLPGVQPAAGDVSAKRAGDEAKGVADFYAKAFGRNSVDDAGKTLVSSVHYGVDYNNAFWNGAQMVYGDGDGNIFVDFTASNDVIGHELTHGVTQITAQLAYKNEAGGLNESMSDVFGSMYRQWRAGQTVDKADWLIGKDIMGPGAKARGYTCLRDMANPAAKHCLAPQPKHYSQYKAGMDPHYSSGIPNLAFCLAANAIGGRSWEKAGKVWYGALTGFAPQPGMKMKTFANRTRAQAKSLFAADPAVLAAIDQAWKAVGL